GLPDLLQTLPIREERDQLGEAYWVPYTKLPVLTYRRGQWEAPDRLHASHITGDWTLLSQDDKVILPQPEEFVRWGKKVVDWVRRHTPERYRYKTQRLTKRVAEAVKSEVQLMD